MSVLQRKIWTCVTGGGWAPLLVVLFWPLSPAYAGANVNTSWGGVAIHGYDPVAYFTEGKPVEGSKAYTHDWMGGEWRFSSQENKDLFTSNPEKYAPQYGGFCAYAVSQGSTADIDPEAWTVYNGKLYLNLSPSIQQIWSEDIPGYIAAADKNWPGLRDG